MNDPPIGEAVLRYALAADGGVYRWGDLFGVLGGEWATHLLPSLDLGSADAATLREIAQRFGVELDRLAQLWDQEQNEMHFHRDSARLLERTFIDLETRLGTPVARSVLAYGTTTNTGNEYLWTAILRSLLSARDDKTGVAKELGISPAASEQLLRFAEEYLVGLPSAEPMPDADDDHLAQALDLVRIAQVGRLFQRLGTEWDPASLQSLLRWARDKADRMGADPSVLELRGAWLS